MTEHEREREPSNRPAAEGDGVPQPGTAEAAEVHWAADAVRRAEAELKKARQQYDELRRLAADRLKAARETSLGDLIDGTLDFVRRHPGPGVIAAGLIGFFLGRRFRR